MRYIPPGVTDLQLYGVSKATVHDPDPGYYRDIVLHSIWEGPEADAHRQQRPPVPVPVPAEDVQSIAADPVSSSDVDAEVQLASYGYKVSFGGMYNVDDYRAM